MNYKMIAASALLAVTCSSAVCAEDKSIASQQNINASVSLNNCNASELIPALSASTTLSSIGYGAVVGVGVGLMLCTGVVVARFLKAVSIIRQIEANIAAEARISRLVQEYNRARLLQ